METFAASLDTPSVVVDMDLVRANIRRFQAYADANGFKVRPHIKTHKLPLVTDMQLAAGAIGITCQKVSEAEAMVAGSPAVTDVLITYNIVGERKLARLAALAQKVRLSVVADSAAVVDGLSAASSGEAPPLRVLVECDTGANRCGVASPEDAAALACAISAAPGLAFCGLMTYPPAGGEAAVQAFMTRAKALIEAEGLAVPVISSGGTPTMMHAAEAPIVTEYRPGTYVYNDRSLVARGACGWDDCALTVLATVVSVPTANRAIIDAGSKTLTSDLLGFSDYGEIDGFESARIVSLSEEHAVVDISACRENFPPIGGQVRIVPNHTCVVSNLFDRMVFHRDGIVTRVEDVAARGTVW